MLILSRKVDEAIVIGEGDKAITMTVLSVKGKQVRLGINAPADVAVHREEIYKRVHGVVADPLPAPGTRPKKTPA